MPGIVVSGGEGVRRRSEMGSATLFSISAAAVTADLGPRKRSGKGRPSTKKLGDTE